MQNGVGQCAALCSSDAACATNQVCAALVYTLPNNRDQAVNVCQPAAGSRTLCNGNNSCSVTGEVCRTFMIGSPSVADPFIFTGSVQTFCAQKLNPAGVDTGADCTTNDCANDYCVNGGSHPNAFCTAPCGIDTDCPAGMLCNANLGLYDNPTTTVRICAYP